MSQVAERATIVDLTSDKYRILRNLGVPPSQIRAKAQEMWSEPIGLGIKHLVSVVIGIVSFCVVDRLMESILHTGGLWVTSPSGKTTVCLPFWTAVRVVRKRGWELTDVEPVQPARRVSRLEAIKIVIRGDR